MHHRIAALCALTGLALSLCLVGTTPAVARAEKEKVCETQDLTGEILDSPCLDSDIVLTQGQVTACVQTVTDPQGRQHQKVSVRGHGQGVDEFGNQYVLIISLQAHGNEFITETGHANATAGLTVNLIGQGDAPDVKCHAILHITRSHDDELIVNFEKMAESCECAPPVEEPTPD